MAETLKEKTAKGLFWGGLSNGAQQLVSLVFGIFLARKLSQDDYGMVGMLTVFSTIASALQEGGFISALNKKKEVEHKDYNAVFWFSTLGGLSLYILLFFCAPLIARFFGESELIPLSRYVFLGFVVSSFGIAPRAWLFRNLRNRETAIISFSSLTISNLVGVLLAWNGYAYWGIATQTIVYVTLFSTLSFYFSGWYPNLQIDFRPLREMIGFSSRLIITNIFNYLNANLFAIVFGRLYSKTDVGNFSQARKWTDMGVSTINNMLGGIAQPVLARVDDDIERQLKVFRKMLRFSAFVSFPAMFGLCIVSEELIIITVTQKWLASVKIMQLLCIAGAFMPISSLLFNLLISRGRSDIYMWGVITLNLLQLVCVCLAAPWGMMWMIRIFVAINIVWIFVWWFFVKREIGLRLRDMLSDLAPYMFLSLALVVMSWFVTYNIENIWLRFLCKTVVVALPYIGLLWLSRSVILRESILFLFHKMKVDEHIKSSI